ncbi:unnamed protein product [Albugo candida]|uniref:Aminopeptidase n=1 Tax=Albugo candida TaxID=65357 RepID=A0A024GFR1_9STRA|nr:unnamed protein product [Albugo candida]|eukprot:CCI45716.1 unnamed protein product [Albugo candida]
MCGAQKTSTSENGILRLPECVLPSKYRIDYHVIDLINRRFEGFEEIDLTVQHEAIDSITFHAANLYLFQFSLKIIDQAETEQVKVEEFTHHLDSETVTLKLSKSIKAHSQLTLTLNFHGSLSDQLRGFFFSEYSHQGEKRLLAATQFEACDARRAFPCWDEPSFKATFQISVASDPNLTVLSNMHVLQTIRRPKQNATIYENTQSISKEEKVWRFAETPPMSTYLVAIVVGEFDVISDVTSEGVLMSVYTTPGYIDKGRFALKTGLKALTYLSNMFDIPYPLHKLDNVVLPDFVGAMENWGLVTYGQYVLLEEEHATKSQKVLSARVVCHELSHQWFGNLVTMDWWTGLWLNEGFASYMECDVADHIYPEWRIWDTFVQESLLNLALVRDAMLSSHPIEVEVQNGHEVDEIFDAISYDKGASLIRMLVAYLGHETFFRGVKAYLLQFKYKNTKTSDLWKSLEQESDLSIRQVAETWTKQTGYPVLCFECDPSEGPRCQVSQNRLVFDWTCSKKLSANPMWDIPLTYRTSKHPSIVHRFGVWKGSHQTQSDQRVYLPEDMIRKLEQVMSIIGNDGWIKFNANQTGLYYVQYPSHMLKRLQNPVRELVFGTTERMGLLAEVFMLAQCGKILITEALNFIDAYRHDPNVLCWKELASHLRRYLGLMQNEDVLAQFKAFIRDFYKPALATVAREAPNIASSCGAEEEMELRNEVITMLSKVGDDDVVVKLKQMFTDYMESKNSDCMPPVPAELHLAVFSTAAATGNMVEVELLQKRYAESKDIKEKRNCLTAMGESPLPDALLAVIDWGMETIPSSEMTTLFNGIAKSTNGADVAWSYLESNWELVNTRLSPWILGSVIATTVSKFCTEEKLKQVEAFLKTRKTHAYAKRLEEALEKVQVNCVLRQRDVPVIAEWLHGRGFA